MAVSSKPTLRALFVAFVNVGLTSVGGALAPLRHVIVTQRRWLTESEMAEMVGIAQVIPGANAVNCCVMIGERFAAPLGPFVGLAGLLIPSSIIAVLLAGVASHLAAENVRFAAAETAVTAAVAGLFAANGLRLVGFLWREAVDVPAAWRLARLSISLLGVVLVAGLHLFVPLAVIVLAAASMAVEYRLRRAAAAA